MVDLGEWEEMNAAYLEVFGERAEFDCVAYTPR
jgi:hypothetical protein